MITEFKNDFRFLSNFWPAPVELDGILFPSVEHAYQAAKTLDLNLRQEILGIESPGKVKRLSRKIVLRKDWDEVKLSVMENLLRQKFRNDNELGKMLLATGDRELIEGNHWGDVFWGVCRGVGENHLGKILMKIRSDLKVEIETE